MFKKQNKQKMKGNKNKKTSDTIYEGRQKINVNDLKTYIGMHKESFDHFDNILGNKLQHFNNFLFHKEIRTTLDLWIQKQSNYVCFGAHCNINESKPGSEHLQNGTISGSINRHNWNISGASSNRKKIGHLFS